MHNGCTIFTRWKALVHVFIVIDWAGLWIFVRLVFFGWFCLCIIFFFKLATNLAMHKHGLLLNM